MIDFVYVLMECYQYDSGDCGLECVGVYETFNQARKSLEEVRDNVKKDFESFNTEESSYSEGDMEWSIWEQGQYCYNHVDLVIVEKQIIFDV